MSRRPAVRWSLSLALAAIVLSACSPSDQTPSASTVELTPQPGPTANRTSPSPHASIAQASETVSPSPLPSTTPSPTPSSEIVTPSLVKRPVAGIRAQFGRFQGGDVEDPCGLLSGLFPPAIEPPFIGELYEFIGGTGKQYPVGRRIDMCLHGFEPGPPITVTTTTPDATKHRVTVTIKRAAGTACSTFLGDCKLSDYWSLPQPLDANQETFTLQGYDTYGPLTAALVGWILPDSTPGEYAVTARQGRTRDRSTIIVKDVEKPSISVARWLEPSGQAGFAAMLLGFSPEEEVSTFLYRAQGSKWKMVGEFLSATTDSTGRALQKFYVPHDLDSGRYCLMSEQTIPTGDPSVPDDDGKVSDPCFEFSELVAGFNVP